MIKGKHKHLEDEANLDSFEYRLKNQKNRVRFLFTKARVGIETYEDLHKELDKIKINIHQYVLTENLQKRLERFRRQVENYMVLYARVHLKDISKH